MLSDCRPLIQRSFVARRTRDLHLFSRCPYTILFGAHLRWPLQKRYASVLLLLLLLTLDGAADAESAVIFAVVTGFVAPSSATDESLIRTAAEAAAPNSCYMHWHSAAKSAIAAFCCPAESFNRRPERGTPRRVTEHDRNERHTIPAGIPIAEVVVHTRGSKGDFGATEQNEPPSFSLVCLSANTATVPASFSSSAGRRVARSAARV